MHLVAWHDMTADCWLLTGEAKTSSSIASNAMCDVRAIQMQNVNGAQTPPAHESIVETKKNNCRTRVAMWSSRHVRQIVQT